MKKENQQEGRGFTKKREDQFLEMYNNAMIANLISAGSSQTDIYRLQTSEIFRTAMDINANLRLMCSTLKVTPITMDQLREIVNYLAFQVPVDCVERFRSYTSLYGIESDTKVLANAFYDLLTEPKVLQSKSDDIDAWIRRQYGEDDITKLYKNAAAISKAIINKFEALIAYDDAVNQVSLAEYDKNVS